MQQPSPCPRPSHSEAPGLCAQAPLPSTCLGRVCLEHARSFPTCSLGPDPAGPWGRRDKGGTTPACRQASPEPLEAGALRQLPGVGEGQVQCLHRCNWNAGFLLLMILELYFSSWVLCPGFVGRRGKVHPSSRLIPRSTWRAKTIAVSSWVTDPQNLRAARGIKDQLAQASHFTDGELRSRDAPWLAHASPVCLPRGALHAPPAPEGLFLLLRLCPKPSPVSHGSH